jgi:hypothetical protein
MIEADNSFCCCCSGVVGVLFSPTGMSFFVEDIIAE